MKVSKTLDKACEVLKNKVRFETASLTLPGSNMFDDDTKTIRESTKLYTESWIIPIIDAIQKGDTNKLKTLIQNEEI